MKKLNKKDYIYLGITIVLFLIIIISQIKRSFFYGSTLDWYSQHISIPEYFRTLFYESKEIFPNFAMNIGGGQNIYNFSYYGLLSPIVIISYFLPFVTMVKYLIFSTVLLTILSTILLYLFLKKHKFSEETCFISSVIFILSSSLSFHSHRHIMFINYMFFLILGLFGIDKKIKDNQNALLIISIFLMIMTSYYFSIGGILVLVIYYLYKVKIENNKDFFNKLIKISTPIIISVMMSAILILPTLYTLLYNRSASNNSISFLNLIIPYPQNILNLVYDSYGVGLPFISFISLIYLLLKDKKNRKLGAVLLVIIFLNIINYFLNGFIYINSKVLIPFLPLFIYIIAIFLEDIIKNKVKFNKLFIFISAFILLTLIFSLKIGLFILAESIMLYIIFYFYNKRQNKIIVVIPLITLSFFISFVINSNDYFEPKNLLKMDDINIADHLSYIDSLEKIEGYKDYYRVNIDYKSYLYPNKIFGNINYLNNTSYSSINNTNFNQFYYDHLTNEVSYRNRALVVSSKNLLSNMFFGNKYFISREKAPHFYDQIRFKRLYIYKNENVLPIGYFNKNVITYKDFEKFNKYEQQLGYLKLIVNDKISNNNYQEKVIKEKLNLEDLFASKNMKKINDNLIELNVNNFEIVNYKLDQKYKNKVLFINFDIEKQDCDLSISINGMKNKLTDKKWKYYNKNTNFNYTLAIMDEEYLKIRLTNGKYSISNLEVYSLDLEEIKNIRDNITTFDSITKNENSIIGKINAPDDGYVMFTIPYDKGFTALVDGVKVKVEKLDYSFIGFPIKKGNHVIKVIYNAPYLKQGKVISLIGLLSFVGLVIYDKKKLKK